MLPSFDKVIAEESVTVKVLLYNIIVFSRAFGTNCGITNVTTVVSYEVKSLQGAGAAHFEGGIYW